METTSGALCEWQCSRDYLVKALCQIREHGSTLLAVTPLRLTPRGPFSPGFDVAEWLVLFQNPVAEIGGDGG